MQWDHPNVFAIETNSTCNAVTLSKVNNLSDLEVGFDREDRSDDDFSECKTNGDSKTMLKGNDNSTKTQQTGTDINDQHDSIMLESSPTKHFSY